MVERTASEIHSANGGRPLLAEIPLTENARTVLEKRYLRRGEDGKPIETIPEMFWRVASNVAAPDAEYGGDVQATSEAFYKLLTSLRFFPNSPTFTGAGTPLGQLAACLTAGMRVTTDHGVKRIADLQIGDRVLTHMGRYRPVTEVHQRAYSDQLLRIKIKLIGTTLEVTPEHPILTPAGWVRAGELAVGDRVAIGLPRGVRSTPHFDLAELVYADELEMQVAEGAVRVRRPSSYQNSGRQAGWINRFIELTPDLARLCGYYVSEGTIGPDERYVRFTFGRDEVQYQRDVTDLIERIFGAPTNRSDSNQGSWTSVNVYSRAVTAWFRSHFGHHSYGKWVSVWMQYASPEIQQAFLVGLMRGDGLYSEKIYLTADRKSPHTFRALRLTLSNPGLIQQVWQMCLRLGYNAAIRSVDTAYVTENARDAAQINFPPLQSRELVQQAFGIDLAEPDTRYVRSSVLRQDDAVYFEVQSIEAENYTGTVYNCEVDEDHSYVTEGVVVHNCFVLPISDDMGRESDGIFQTLRDAALIQQTGGGNGFAFSRLRPKGDYVKSSAGRATGPVGFLRVYDKAFGEIAQGGCLTPDTLVFTEKGLLRLDELADPRQLGWKEHDLSLPTDEGVHRSPRSYNNGVVPIFRVRTREGLTLAGTPNHKVKVMTPDGPAWRQLDELQAGDSILVMLGQHAGRLQALKQVEQRHGNQVAPTLPPVLDEELAFFLGYLTGDGFVAQANDDHRIGVTVAHTSYLIEDMPKLMERIFGVKVHANQKPNDASTTFVIDNWAVKEYLQVNGLAKGKSTEACVPRLIRMSPAPVVGAYLRGLFEADGALSHGYPALTAASERLAHEVATLLIGLGAPVKVWRAPASADRLGKTAPFVVRLTSHVALAAWAERIGCDRRSRFNVCYIWRPDMERESSYTLPYPAYWLAPVLEAVALPQTDARSRGMGRNFRSIAPRLRRSLLRYLRGDRRLTLSAYRALAERYPQFAERARPVEGVWFVSVSRVEPAGESLTLDLEVEGNHTYLANGLVTHNTRRGANMAVLRVDHPDIEEFITCKVDENQITNFNISVGITDAFMRAVENDEPFNLINPRDGKVWKTVRARDLFDKIVRYAHHNGEPGALFLDAANRSNPVPHLYQLEATNPCGEQWLGPYENCCLGSINLAQHVTPEGRVDWEKLRETTELSTRFLDNVVSANQYVPAVPQLKEAALRARRIGLGIMGLGDLMYHMGIRYGSEEAQEFAAQVMEFVRYHSMKISIELARERGPFLAIKGSIYDPENLKWTPPKPITPYSRDFGRPPLDWDGIVAGIKQHGIRNAAQTTIAPTGTIATVAGCEAYGCEPVFALAYIRHVNDHGRDLELTYTSPLFEQALIKAGLDEPARKRIVDDVILKGTCQHIEEVPPRIRHAFVVSQDITAEEHVRMQAALQAFVDNSISKCVTGDTLVLTAQGLMPIAELSGMRLPDQFEPMALDVITPSGDERAEAFYYGGMRETRRVRLSHGYQIEGTPNHRIHVLGEDGRIRFARLDELRIGDTVVLYSGQQVFGPAGQLLPRYYGEACTNSKQISFPERMSPELAYVLGCITSEGAITRNGVMITNGDRGLLERLAGLFEQLFGLSSHICKDPRRESVYTLQINSRALRNWLSADLGLAAGARNKIIPTCILRASRHEIAAYLRGLFLDSYMTRDGRMFGIGLASRGLIQQLQVLLLNFGVVARVHRSAEHAWALTVAGSALERLAAFVEFDEVWKLERLALRHEGRQHRLFNYIDLMPGALTDSLRRMQTASANSLRSLYGEQTPDYQRARVNLLEGHRLDRQTATRLSGHFGDAPDAYTQAFFGDDRTGCLYVEVEGLESGFTEVFDLSVPGSHTFIANGLGNHNTCNFPADATEKDVADAYFQAWRLGCKGLTVYVTGSREKVVLETRETKEKKTAAAQPAPAPAPAQVEQPAQPLPVVMKPRPRWLPGRTYRVQTPLGTAFITINENGGGQPFELFMNVGKAGSDTAAVAEALGRLISLVLRLPSPMPALTRLRQVIDQLAGIGGGRPTGFGPQRVRSLPDGVAQALADYLSDRQGGGQAASEVGQVEPEPVQLAFKIGDLCPECGEASLVNEEGCRKCYTCGFTEC